MTQSGVRVQLDFFTLPPQYGLTQALMIDKLRTLRARFVARDRTRSHSLVIQAWLWLVEQADELEDKRRCLNEVLRLDPENGAATLALLLLDQRRPTS